ncbi:MAG: hypothetical protein M5R36_20725 [Deltaproteobacteria bacterium]|nr:hypothetical protein [Deltaproteobacteria bacterium]
MRALMGRVSSPFSIPKLRRPTSWRDVIRISPVAARLDDILAHSEIDIVEIALPPREAAEAAFRCVESGLAIGLRTTAVLGSDVAARILDTRRRDTAFRLFSPAFYCRHVEIARDLMWKKEDLGDPQVLRVQSLIGRAAVPSLGGSYWATQKGAPATCTPEYEALPLMFLMGEVRSVFAAASDRVTHVHWTADDEPGGARYGVFEAVRARDLVVKSMLEPVDLSFEAAGTDGYLFASGLIGNTRERPRLARYVGESYEVLSAGLSEDPLTPYEDAARDLVDAVANRTAVRFGAEWLRDVGLVRDAIVASVKNGREIRIETEE